VSRRLRIGIDTGGTFTDVVASTRHRRDLHHEDAVHPSDPSIGVLDGIRKILRLEQARRRGAAVAAARAPTAPRWRPTRSSETVSRLGLVTTQGFRHVLGDRAAGGAARLRQLYFWVKPERIVPLHLVREVPSGSNFPRRGAASTSTRRPPRQAARWFRITASTPSA
jgi:N-methylhydantoinase A